jgi:hypothetical protein
MSMFEGGAGGLTLVLEDQPETPARIFAPSAQPLAVGMKNPDKLRFI